MLEEKGLASNRASDDDFWLGIAKIRAKVPEMRDWGGGGRINSEESKDDFFPRVEVEQRKVWGGKEPASEWEEEGGEKGRGGKSLNTGDQVFEGEV